VKSLGSRTGPSTLDSRPSTLTGMHVTLLGPEPPSAETPRISALPPDLLEQVRGRVRLLTLLLFITSAIGPVLYCVSWAVGTLMGDQIPPEFYARSGFVLSDAGIAQGGMGEVWRARHRMLARPAAIKLIRPSLPAGLASAEAQRRFEHEAQVIARLRSPHTVELFDFGVADNGAFYYVMELLDGLDADALVRRFGPVPAERAIFLLRQVCHSLAEAESRGLVHRDIKPANIFLCRYGQDYDFVKVLDFGLVKALDREANGGPGLTRENVVQGTPAFIAPEQAMGDVSVDNRADIYATGCVAYWLLTGQFVFTAETPLGILLHHAQTRATAPSARTELPIPPALELLVLECLSKNPADRPQSARELSRRLAEIPCASASGEERARDWWASHQPAHAPAPQPAV
ncbi:MAG: serine/threonine protein kinase, partial [Gemmatimonadales bacterium]|nr:serine/threonine protein kinase [Gemmatimonadales bacterium]